MLSQLEAKKLCIMAVFICMHFFKTCMQQMLHTSKQRILFCRKHNKWLSYWTFES